MVPNGRTAATSPFQTDKNCSSAPREPAHPMILLGANDPGALSTSMKWWPKALALAVSGMAVAWAGQAGSQAAQAAAPETTPMTSEQVFKNIQVLKGIPVDDFMGTMGLMSAAL